MVLLAVFATVASFVDPREVTGVNVWLKPLKFAISTAVYSVTLSWLLGQLRRMRRAAWIAGTVATVGLAIELVIITGFAAARRHEPLQHHDPAAHRGVVGDGRLDLGRLGRDAAGRDRAVPQPARRSGAHLRSARAR